MHNMQDQSKSRIAVSWIARILTMAFAAFLSIFALDVFSNQLGIWEIISHLLLHLIPSFVIILVLLFSWRREWIGCVAFLLLGIAYIGLTWNRFGPFAYPAIWAPLMLLSLLYCFSWRSRKKMASQN